MSLIESGEAYLAGRRTELLHELINSHYRSRRALGRKGKLLAGTVDLDVTAGVVVLALDSPVGADIGLASVIGSDLARSKRHLRYDTRQGRIV